MAGDEVDSSTQQLQTITIPGESDPVIADTTHDNAKERLSTDESPAKPIDMEKGSQRVPPERLFSIFTKHEKWALIFLGSSASLFSPMSSYIYFPAIPLLANDFNVSVSLMNLTVTFYLIFQGLSPMLWGPLADTKGRRPVYLACLSLLSVTCIALALVPTDKWWLMLVFRCLQASGSASTVALVYGLIADIATPAERGGFGGLAGVGALLGPCIGPVIGGIFAGSLGWRWIFWFLCIFSSVCLGAIFLFLPETLRSIVGNGGIPAPWWDRPIVPLIGPSRRQRHVLVTNPIPPTLTKWQSNPFRFFREPDIVLILIANGLVYSLFVSIQATTSLLFQSSYPSLTQSEIGLCFLPMGAGMLVSSLVTGRILDWQYKKDRQRWEDGVGHPKPFSREEESTFPIEKARLKWAVGYTVTVAGVSIVYGWATLKRAPLAIPLILQFAAGWLFIGQSSSCQTYLIDLFPKAGSSTTAINNFVRCSIAAGITSAIKPILDAMGAGWCFVLLGGICLVVPPVTTVVIMRHGPRWRAERNKRIGVGG